MTTLHLTAHLTSEDTFHYIHVPFEVPQGIGRIDVAYQYGAAISSDPSITGGNTVDIGLIDPRGTQFMTQGFRGWSGSARQRFYVALDSATPGYLAGAIDAGQWNICLGAYKVAPEGCAVEISVDLTPAVAPAFAGAYPALLPVRQTTPHGVNSDHWYKGELHCHTVHSDGDTTVEDVIRMAEGLGLDFLAITDHNNRSQLVELATANTSLTLIPGYEVTTYYGHWNIWGSADWIDFRVQTAADMQRAMDTAVAQGYVVSCNHPRPYGPDWAFGEVEGYATVEIWNGPWELLNDHCLAFWDKRLQAGKRLVAVGGSDFHFSKFAHDAKLAQPTTYIYCAETPTAAQLLKGLRAGHAFISESPTGPRLELRMGSAIMGDQWDGAGEARCVVTVLDGAGCEVQLCTAAGVAARFPVRTDADQFTYVVSDADARYVRAQIYDLVNQRYRAFTNPIYVGRA